MQLKTLHFLCTNEESAQSVRDSIGQDKTIIERWEVENKKSVSLFYLVTDQDQDLFDDLLEVADKDDTIRLIVQTVDASIPKTFKEARKEKEENTPFFFDAISREEMQEIIKPQARLNGTFLSLVVLSSIVASIALIMDNVPLLIGAMVLTPLLGPNMALALACATTDIPLTKRAIMAGGAGVVLSFAVAVLIGFIYAKPAGVNVTPLFQSYGYGSILVGICAGISATILLLQGKLSSLIGVMVAVAFLPPIAMTGLALSAGRTDLSLSALMLFAINLAAFNLSAKVVLFIAGIRPKKSDNPENGSHLLLLYIAAWFLAVSILALGLYFT